MQLIATTQSRARAINSTVMLSKEVSECELVATRRRTDENSAERTSLNGTLSSTKSRRRLITLKRRVTADAGPAVISSKLVC